jgi:hypothetical protein
VRAYALARLGRYDEAAPLASRCAVSFAEQSRAPMLCAAWIAEAWVAAGLGDGAAFDRVVERLAPEIARLGLVDRDISAAVVRIRAILLASGETARADRLAAVVGSDR